MAPAYRLNAGAIDVARALAADPAGDVWAGGEVVPGGYAPVVIADREGHRHMVPRQWGVPPPPRGAHLVPFVRNLESPFWIGVLRHTDFRCLVPMTAFRGGSGWFTAQDSPIFACAAIWRDSEVPSFAILTSGSTAGMPVSLQPEDHETWLRADFKRARMLVGG